jgi:virulence factor Mce-like protein
MRRRTTSAVLANPVLVGAVTVLVVVVAVFLAYNANNGLPFVPTFELRADIPNGTKLVPGNEVRQGGHRIGAVSELTPHRLKDGTIGAQVVLKLDKSAAPFPRDTTVRIRPRSALGLKYVELTRGHSKKMLADGATLHVGQSALSPELQQFFNIFNKKTRDNVGKGLIGFGNGFAGRGDSLNLAFEALPGFLKSVPPVMNTLARPDTQLANFFIQLERAARITAPLADTAVQGFHSGAQTFHALSQDPAALEQTIQESPPTLAVGTSALARMRPFLRSLARISPDLRSAAGALRTDTGAINVALRSGIGPLQQLPTFNARLKRNLKALKSLASAPESSIGVAALDDTFQHLNPIARFIGPYQTVCNYWNYSWTFLADHITDSDQTGEVERIRVKQALPPSPAANLANYGQSQPVDTLHAQTYGAAIGPNGDADCETGQRGFPRHLLKGSDPSKNLAGDPATPGLQGPTFKGRPRVPKGETFTDVPQGLSPNIRLPAVDFYQATR